MPITESRPVRHREAAPRGHTTINIDLGATTSRRATLRAPARDAAASIVAMADTFCRDARLTRDSMARTRDSLARLGPIVQARNAAKVADAAFAARAERSSPASIQAANATRWPRGGR